jgi:hypothetical protein
VSTARNTRSGSGGPWSASPKTDSKAWRCGSAGRRRGQGRAARAGGPLRNRAQSRPPRRQRKILKSDAFHRRFEQRGLADTGRARTSTPLDPRRAPPETVDRAPPRDLRAPRRR